MKVVWSRFGLWRYLHEPELTPDIEADLHTKGYHLTWDGSEPVAILNQYPDQEPAEVLTWINQKG